MSRRIGRMECEECMGTGVTYTTCFECGGDKEIDCKECDGTGEVDDPDYEEEDE